MIDDQRSARPDDGDLETTDTTGGIVAADRAVRSLLRPGLVTELVGEDLVILDTAANRVVAITPAAADDAVVAGLGELGLLADSAVTRRRLLTRSAVVGASVVTALALPTAAAAVSGPTPTSSTIAPGLAAPENVAATARIAEIAVSWDAVAGATGYTVYYKASGDVSFTAFPAGSGTTATVTGLTDGVQYEVYVVASDGAASSPDSDSAFATPLAPDAQAGVGWVVQTSAADNSWYDVAYGNGLFVAVASSGTQRVMTSPDGITWTSRNTAERGWNGVTHGNGLFVAVANFGTGNRVMTSPDGIIWTDRTSANESLNWQKVTYGTPGGSPLFVAVASAGTGTQRVMTSPDGITWTARETGADFTGALDVTYGNGLFVAVGNAPSGTRVMTSSDGVTWTLRSTPADNNWTSVAYGNGRFVAVSTNGVNRAMTSTDGITWTLSSLGFTTHVWTGVTYGAGRFVAVAQNGPTGKRAMTSTNGTDWTVEDTAADNAWTSVAYGNGVFVAVGATGTGDRVMISPQPLLP